MRPRDKASGKAAKTQHPKTLKGHNKTARVRSSRIARKETNVARLTRERDEALEQQRTTADVLKIISRSSVDLEAVLDMLVETAARLCRADQTAMYRRRDDKLHHLVAACGFSEEAKRFALAHPLSPGRGTTTGRVILERRAVHIPDVLQDPEFTYRDGQKAIGFRTVLGIPLLREDALLGIFAITRTHVEPFTDKEIELATTFADQAVIAIENARLFNETKEALERQTATADILKVIASSPDDVQPVFEAIATSANRLIGGFSTAVQRVIDDIVHLVAFTPTNPESDEALKAAYPFHRSEVPAIALAQNGETAQIPDAETADAHTRRLGRARGWRSVTFTPLMSQGAFIGFISCTRRETGVLADRHVQLLQTFADQAVIAIENVRLFNETKEALEQQAATSDILRVISQSPTDVQPVFEAIVLTAVRLTGCDLAFFLRCDGATYSPTARATPEGLQTDARPSQPIDPAANFPSRAIVEKKTLHLPDWSLVDPPAYEGWVRETFGIVSSLYLPLLCAGDCIGLLVLAGKRTNIFGDREIALAESFRDQAVIAIENVRLFDEVQAKTRDLEESLQQQTATADVLKVISRSTFDLQRVLDTLTHSAARLCEADMVIIHRNIDGNFPGVASFGLAEEERRAVMQIGHKPGRGSLGARILLENAPVLIDDAEGDPEYTFHSFQRRAGMRSMLGVPLMREGVTIGLLLISRAKVQPFTKRHVDLATTFADQAVIAIENVRLFDEVQMRTEDLRESLQQQTATADVLKVISRSTFDLQTVLQTLVESAARLCDSDKATITREKDGQFYRAEIFGYSDEFLDYVRDVPVLPERGSCLGRALLEGVAVHIPDVLLDPEYTFSEGQRLGGFRSMLGVPMLREGIPIGVVALTRSEPRPFTDKQIELVTTFADQAAIAIENVRLFESVEARTRELARSLEDLRTAQDRLVQTEKLASLGQLTAGIAHEIKNPLNFVNNFSALSAELTDELNGVLKPVAMDGKVREEVDELTGMLKDNLEKVVQHGKRADSIVKNMLLHSRQGSGEHRPVDINAIVDESLNLAYHGARAENTGFNIAMHRSFDPAVGMADGYPQEITRALLNLISNGFYAATKRKADADDGFEPTLTATTRNLGDKVEIRIRDNGTGIPAEAKEKIFNPFFTTKPAGEGTGLGLSMSHDIIVKQHGGRIEVETELGQFSEFRIVLPRAGGSLIKPGERS